MPSQQTVITRPVLQLVGTRQSTGCAADCKNIPDRASTCIEVDLLGGLQVRAGHETMGPRELGSTKIRRVLLALILARGAAVSKDRLVSMLWEGAPPSGAKATLESYVCVLRKRLQPCHEVRTSLITTVAGCYAIDMSRVDLDLVRYEHLMSEALAPAVSAAEALPRLERAMSLVESSLLPEEIDCEWLDDVRKTHHQNVRKALVAAAVKVAEMPSRSAEGWARKALEGDPLDESAWLALLRCLEASGQHAQGLWEYNRCRGVFAAELGCAPGSRLQEMYVRLLRGANEADAELTHLLDAVTRLHAERKLHHSAPKSPISAISANSPGVHRRRAHDHARSIEQARRSLDLLLCSVGEGREHPVLGHGA
jgi:DNA-binding SARP family transcriptional activator